MSNPSFRVIGPLAVIVLSGIEFTKTIVTSDDENMKKAQPEIDRLEKKLIESTVEYLNIMKTKREEQNKLREIAENFLDDENVTNDEIREAYIDWYVDKMTNENSLDSDFIQYHKYTMLSDVWYVFAKATNNNSLLNEIERRTLAQINSVQEFAF
mgnify:CR=1 FL=1